MSDEPGRSVLFVHAHPDDETIGTGATMAYYAAAGAKVTLVTCTLGEEGEIHVPALAGLAAAEADQLGGYRIAELDAACAALGVADHRFLAGAGRYRDSGMMGLPTNAHPRAFWQADLDEAAQALVDVMREVRPQVVVTYDPNGGYGHPDHIQAHRVTMRACELADKAGIAPAKIYWTAIPRSALQRGMREFAGASDNPFAGVERVEDLPIGTPDEEISTRVDANRHGEAKIAAMRAHATQISADSWLFTIARNFGADAMGVEYFRLASGTAGPGSGMVGPGSGMAGPGSGTAGPGSGPLDWEDDLFAGLLDRRGEAAP